MSVKIRQDMPEQTLVDGVLGKETSIPRGWAISLVPAAGVRDAPGLLRKVLENEGEALKPRRLAAAALWRTNTAESRQVLLDAVQTVKDPWLLTGIVKFLGRVGDERALEAVQAIQSGGEGILAAQASFAAALIAHRLGLPGNDLPVPRQYEPMPPTDQRRIKFTPPRPEEVELFAQCLRDEPYDIPIDRSSQLQIQCGGGRWMLAFSEAFAAAAGSALRKRKTVVGLLAVKNTEDGRYSVAFLLFSAPRPDDKQVAFLVHRTTGEQAWAGVIEPGATGEAKFALHTAGRLGIVPIEVEGVWRKGKLETTKAISASKVTEKQEALRIEAPPRS